MSPPPTQENFAIIFSNVPSHYTVQDIILNHFPKKKKKKAVSQKVIDRLKRQITDIQIIPNESKCIILFSSIFYWAKYARIIIQQQQQLNSPLIVHIQPKSIFETIKHIKNIQFICKCNQSLIPLFELNPPIYSFIYDGIVYITTKKLNDNQTEYLIEINHINTINTINNSNDVMACLSSPSTIYEYYHRNQEWICKICKSINNNQSISMKCRCCNEKIDDRNPYHYQSMMNSISSLSLSDDLNKLNKMKYHVMNQKEFYRNTTAFLIDDDVKEPVFNLFEPVFNIMKKTIKNRNINHVNMFSNVIKLSYPPNTTSMDQYLLAIKDTQSKTIDKYPLPIINAFDFASQASAIEVALTWIHGENPPKYPLLFPLIARLFDFKNPQVFSKGIIEGFIKTISLEYEEGVTLWILQDVIMNIKQFDVGEANITKEIEDTEQKYEVAGIDPTDEDCKKNYYQLIINPFNVSVAEISADLLMDPEWKQMNKVANNNHIITLSKLKYNSLYCNLYNNIRAMILYNEYILTSTDKMNSIFRYIHNSDNNIDQYICSMCDNYLIWDKYKQLYKNDVNNENENDNDNDNNNNNNNNNNDQMNQNIKAIIEPQKLYQPIHPSKKFKKEPDHDVDILMKNNNNNNNNIVDIKPIKVIKQQQDPPIVSFKPYTNYTNSNNDLIRTQIKNKAIKNVNNDLDNDADIDDIDDDDDDDVDMDPPNDYATIDIDNTSTNINKPLKRRKPRSKRKRAMSPPARPPIPTSSPILSNINNGYVSSSSTTSSSSLSSSPASTKIELKYNPALKINAKGFGIAYGVPIYNRLYFECANFHPVESDQFNTQDFAQKCIANACKCDAIIRRQLRRTSNFRERRREYSVDNAAPPAFVSGCADPHYVLLFGACFTRKHDDMYDINLKKYHFTKKKKKEYVIFEEGFGIHKDRVNRLYLLMLLFLKYMAIGCVDIKHYPPWYKNESELVMNKLANMAIDLTKDDNNFTSTTATTNHHHNGNKNKNKNNIIKQEIILYSEDNTDDSDYIQ